MSNSGILIFGIILILVGVFLILSSVDLRHLQPLDLTIKTSVGEVTATNLPPGAESKIMSGFVIAIIGAILIKVGK